MTMTDRDLASAVVDAMRDPGLRDQITDPNTQAFITYIEKQVISTEKPSGIAECDTLDRDIRRRILTQRIATTAVVAANFGAQEDAKRPSRAKISINNTKRQF